MIRQLLASAWRGGPNVPEPYSPSVGVVTDAHKVAFVENGYCVLPSQIAPTQISAAKREIFKSLGKPNRSQNGPGGQFIPPKISACPELMNHRHIMAAVKPALSHVHALLGKGTLPLWAIQIAIRYPGDMCIPGTYQPIPGWRNFCHVDGMEAWPPNRFVCLVGVALTPCQEMGGSLVVFPGSHRTVSEFLTPAPTTKPDKLPNPAASSALQVTMQPGDVVISHYLLQHSFSPHNGDEPRIMLYARLHYPNYEHACFHLWREWPGLWDIVASMAVEKDDIAMLVWLMDMTDGQEQRYSELRRQCLAKLTSGGT